MEGRPCAILENFARSLPEVRLSELVSLNAVALSPWGGDLKLLEEDLDSFLASGLPGGSAGRHR